MSRRVRAAGGVVLRREGGDTKVLLVHRPRYDDWTLPKGKARADESDEDCALREVEEETGIRCRLGREVARVSYTDSRGRPKSVRYWAMTPVSDPTEWKADGDEVDEARWLARDEAAKTLTYEHDRTVLASIDDEGGTP